MTPPRNSLARLAHLLAFHTHTTVPEWQKRLASSPFLSVDPRGAVAHEATRTLFFAVRETPQELLEALLTEGLLGDDTAPRAAWRYGCLGCTSGEAGACLRDLHPHPRYVPSFRSPAEVLAFAAMDPARVLQAAELLVDLQRIFPGNPTHLQWSPFPIDRMPPHLDTVTLRDAQSREMRSDGTVVTEAPPGTRPPRGPKEGRLRWLWTHGFHVQGIDAAGSVVRYYTPFREGPWRAAR